MYIDNKIELLSILLFVKTGSCQIHIMRGHTSESCMVIHGEYLLLSKNDKKYNTPLLQELLFLGENL